ncbi:MAG: hypothetical protein ABI700_20130 [Chloroflexota bacterium]
MSRLKERLPDGWWRQRISMSVGFWKRCRHQRAGEGEVRRPLPQTHAPRADRPLPPLGFIGAHFAAGRFSPRPYLVDRGLNGGRWLRHWREYYHASVIAIPPTNSPDFHAWTRADCRWHASGDSFSDKPPCAPLRSISLPKDPLSIQAILVLFVL